MPKRYQLAPLARRDLKTIYRYTNQTWNEVQAELYITELELMFRMLAGQPQLARQINEIKQGYKSFPYKSHVIYLTEQSDHITIIRVLHGRMDRTRLL